MCNDGCLAGCCAHRPPGSACSLASAPLALATRHPPSPRLLPLHPQVPFSDNAKTFVQPAAGRIGRKYLKARYVEFTDATFKTRKVRLLTRRAPWGAQRWEFSQADGLALVPVQPGRACAAAGTRPPWRAALCLSSLSAALLRAWPPSQRRAAEWEHLGVMGPVIRGVVGDTIKVVFRNMLPPGSHNVSMHPHGVLYNKDSEGSPYADGLPCGSYGRVVWQRQQSLRHRKQSLMQMSCLKVGDAAAP